jgi:hypothetical protein
MFGLPGERWPSLREGVSEADRDRVGKLAHELGGLGDATSTFRLDSILSFLASRSPHADAERPPRFSVGDQSPADMAAELSDDDQGKAVVNSNERIATITDVAGDTAYVDPNWNEIPEDVLEQFDWDRSDAQHKIPESAFTGVQDDAAYLRDDLL